jgi:hypothetical protein
MAEIAEIVPKLRSLLALTSDEESLTLAKTILGDIGDSLSGDISRAFKEIGEELDVDNGIYKVNENIFSENIESILSTGSLEPIFNMAEQEISLESRELIDVFSKLTSDLPERQLENIAAESRAQFSEISSESTQLKEIETNIDNTVDNQKIIEGSSKLKTIDEFFNSVKSGSKVIVIAGIAISMGYFLAEYIKNYISAKSGAFLISTNSDGTLFEQKISKYSCMYPKDAQIDHPFDVEITKYLNGKGPCAEVDKYGPCGGWATIGPESRLAVAKIDVSKLGKNKTLKCRKATAYDAIFDLTNHFLRKVGEVIKKGADTIVDIIASFIKPFAPVLALLGGVIVAGITYYATGSLGTYARVGIALAVGLVIALMIYFLIKNFKSNISTQNSSIEPTTLFTETYLQCPMCRSSVLDTCYQPFYVIHQI